MSPQIAKDLINKLSHWFFFSQGIPMKTPEFITGNYTLLDFIEANEIVKAANKEVMEGPGPKTLSTTFDDRLLAAAYVALSYDVQEQTHIVVNMRGCGTIQMITE